MVVAEKTREERLASLPKWARIEIQRLEANLKSAEEKLATATGVDGSKEAAFKVSRYGEPDLFLPYDRIERGSLTLKAGYDDQEYVEVTGSNGVLSVQPRSGNVIRVYCARREWAR
jgi:hypothetical protein